MRYRLLLLAIACLALALRIIPPFGNIFTQGHVNFSGMDSYYYMESMRNYLSVFPHINLAVWNLYEICVVGLTWAVTFGHPTAAILERVAVFIPPVLALGTTIFVFMIGRRLFGIAVGLIAAGAIAVLPGEYFGRTILGAMDTHAFEVFLTTGAIYCLIEIAALKNLLNWRAVLYAVGALAFAYVYRNIWVGAPMMLFILLIFVGWILVERLNQSNFKLGKLALLIGIIFLAGLIIPYFNVFVSAFKGFSREVMTATQETQPGWTSYLILGHMAVLSGMLAFIYKAKTTLKWPLIIWSAFLIAATFWQRRFDYYLIIPFCIIGGGCVAGWYEYLKAKGASRIFTRSIIGMTISACVFVLAVPSYISMLGQNYATPSTSWYNALTWIKKETPPDSQILAWWDYGYWIRYIGVRVSLITPTQEAGIIPSIAKQFLSGQDVIISENVSYLMVDEKTADYLLPNMAVWAGYKPENVDESQALVHRLYAGQKIEGYKLVFDNGVKIFEIQRPVISDNSQK